MLTGGVKYQKRSEDELTSVSVWVYREGAKESITKITVEYTTAASQAKWEKFMIDVGAALGLQGIDGVYTEIEGYIVARKAWASSI
jgi:hypothetical protein